MHKMHAFVRFREMRRASALRRLVRARASHRPPGGELLRQPLHQHALVDPDAGAVDPLGWRDADRRSGRDARRCAVGRSARGDVAHLLRVDLQPGAAEGRCDAEGDAEEILAQHAGDLARSPPDRRCAQSGAGNDRQVCGMLPSRRKVSPTHWRPSAQSSLAATCAHRGRRCSRMRANARAAISTNARPRRCSAKGRSMRAIMFVGEQPGDQEDLAGRPFVGPAGQLFDARAGEGGHRPRRDLRHQCGKALQIRAARQAAHPQQARRAARSRPAAGG